MGQEIRRVPPNWEHPKDEHGHYKPMLDEDYSTALKEWQDACASWIDGTHEDLVSHPELKGKYPHYSQWAGGRPDPEYCRPAFDEEATHYQIYETVSEGTPASPVFASLDEMKAWLLEQGFSEKASAMFIEGGYAPSMVFVEGKGVSGFGIHSLDWLWQSSGKGDTMTNLDDLIKKLAYVRSVEARYKGELAEIEAEIQERFGKALERARELLEAVGLDVADAEEAVRKTAIASFETDGDKQPHPAVTVKVFKSYSYDEDTAFEYARQHLPQALKLERRTFEKAASVLDLDFVTIREEPKATISRDLSVYLKA